MYTVKFTDKSKTPINIDEEQIDNSTAISLFGRKRLSYGKNLQENLLHILENFSCPEDMDVPGTPDKIKSLSGIFDNPIEGQCWYNSTAKTLTFYDGSNWVPFAREDDIAANWGVIVDGQYLPKPISEITGKIFDYPECVWIVSPFSFPQKLDYMECSADETALVSMKYRLSGSDELIGGTANYLIIGISGNQSVPQPTFVISPTPTPTPTSSAGASPTPTPTVTATVTPSITVTPSPTPQATISPTPSITPSKTYTIPPSATRSPTPTPTPVASVTPTPTPTPSPSSVNGGCGPCYTNCPLTSALLPDGRKAGDVKVGDILTLGDEQTLENYYGKVTYSATAIEKTVRIKTKNGIELSCSTTAPLATDVGFINAVDVLGYNVAVWDEGNKYFDQVIDVENLGDQEVQNITVDNKSFWVGDNSNKFVLHHNLKWCCDARGNCESIPPGHCECYIC